MEQIVEPYGAAAVVGIAGRAGQYVDNLTLIGAELVRVTGTAFTKGTTRGTRANVAMG